MHLFDVVSSQYFQVFVGFLFSGRSDFSWFGCSTPSVMCRLPVFITSMGHYSMPNSIPKSWRYILIVYVSETNSFSFLAKSLMSSICIKWLIFSCDLLSFYPAVHLLTMWLSGIIAITDSKGDSASLWYRLLWIFNSVKLFPPAANSTLQVSMIF